jgi:hypothetical protein
MTRLPWDKARRICVACRYGVEHKTARAVRAALAALARPTSPLSKPIKKRDTTWVEPRFDAEITYATLLMTGWCGIRRSNASFLELHPSPR